MKEVLIRLFWLKSLNPMIKVRLSILSLSIFLSFKRLWSLRICESLKTTHKSFLRVKRLDLKESFQDWWLKAFTTILMLSLSNIRIWSMERFWREYLRLLWAFIKKCRIISTIQKLYTSPLKLMKENLIFKIGSKTYTILTKSIQAH